MPDDPNSCLAIFPQQRSTIDGNRTRWYWEDVKCDEPKAYFICSYTNGNFFYTIHRNQTNKQGWLVVYFDLHLCAGHAKHWWKYAFHIFLHKKLKRGKKQEK